MAFDKWFNSQSVLLKAILLLIPGVNWVMELLIRLSVMLRTKSVLHIVVFIVFLCVGWGWFLGVIDFIYMLVTGHLIFAE
ncbi:MAG: hypothetical protein SO373_00925 [Candidatus Borkfalkiaceae bacterium]|nr:hypothetical protein [Christensenellaceae bacterium]